MYVVTFYSFKGGVGRTLALLNVAYEIADSGQRVLVVDFDLEAPAIRPDRWKQGANDDETDHVGRGPTDPGVVEFVTRYLETMRVPPVTDYIVDATPEGCRGHLAVMSTGAVDGTYGQRLNAIDWGLLYAARDGYVMFEDVRAQWQAAGFDYVLLDSRTGFTDVGGICTRHLPDAVVSLFRTDDQSLGGTAQMADAIRAEVPTPRRADDIEQHFVMAGIPDADDEHGHLARRRKVFVDRLGIPSDDRLTEIRHYSSMDLLTQPIYTMERRGTRLAQSYLALTRRIRARNVGDRDGVLDGLRDRHLPAGGRHTDYLSHTDYLNRVGKRYSDDSEVLAMVAAAYRREGHLLEAARLLDKASGIGQLTLPQLYSLARSRHLTGDLESALQALRSFFDGSAEPNGETPRALVVEALDLLQLLAGEDVGGIVADSPVIAGSPPSTRAAVAVRLDRSVSERRAATAILLGREAEGMLRDTISCGCDCGHDDCANHLLIKALARVIERQRGDLLPHSGNPTGGRVEAVCFRALVEMIESNSGVGFVNADQGHPAYAMGRRGKVDPVTGGDGPEDNCLFKLLQRFPPEHHEQIRDLRTWSKFCSLAFSAYRHRR